MTNQFKFPLLTFMVSEDTSEWVLKNPEAGDHTLTIKKFGIIISEGSVSIKEYDKNRELKDALDETGSYLFISLLTPFTIIPAFFINPLLALADLAAPFAAIKVFFQALFNFLFK